MLVGMFTEAISYSGRESGEVRLMHVTSFRDREFFKQREGPLRSQSYSCLDHNPVHTAHCHEINATGPEGCLRTPGFFCIVPILLN
jgi:hypothetical protein